VSPIWDNGSTRGGCYLLRSRSSKSGLTLVEVLVVVLIMAVLVSVALPIYLQSVHDSEVNTCKTNMGSIATAVQAYRTRSKQPYFEGPVDEGASALDGPLQDLHNAVPRCPAGETFDYLVEHEGDGFLVRCQVPGHPHIWRGGGFSD
jgi:prepilin-type N-terminal cleavage/methylation domain-containing protein